MPRRTMRQGLRNAAFILFVFITLPLLALLSGCVSTTDYRRPVSEGGSMVGPYDITLSSHQEALGIKAR